jgi:hypothetical protein
MISVKRKTWTKDETGRLISLWDEIASITVLSILMERSTSSIQTQASRIGLPRRSEHLKRHRRRWSRSEEKLFERSFEDAKYPDGRIDIYEIASDLNRSVDAVAAKIQEKFTDEPTMLSLLVIPDEIKEKIKIASQENKKENKVYKKRGEIKDLRYYEIMRDCLSCRNPFWSEGAHNRVCDQCKKANGSADSE